MTVVVTPAPVSISSGVTANNKLYDGTAAATLSFSNIVLTGILNQDAVTVNTNEYSASFASIGIGHAIPITVTGLTLDGISAGNYSLSQPENLTANIVSPMLQMAGGPRNLVVSWPVSASAYVLEEAQSLTPPATWTLVTNAVTINGTNNSAAIDTSNGAKFFKLVAAPQ